MLTDLMDYTPGEMISHANNAHCALCLCEDENFDGDVIEYLQQGISFCAAIEQYLTDDKDAFIPGEISMRRFLDGAVGSYEGLGEALKKASEIKSNLQKVFESKSLTPSELEETHKYLSIGMTLLQYSCLLERLEKENKK